MITTIERDGRIRYKGELADEVRDALVALFEGTGSLVLGKGYLFWIWKRNGHKEWTRRAEMLYSALAAEGYEVGRTRPR